jgi:DNA processing protein
MGSSTPALAQQERLDRLRLIRSENVGPTTFRHLVRYFGSAGAALAALPDLARRGGRAKIRVCPAAEAERELAAVEAAGARLVAPGEAGYPPGVAELADAPPLLTVKGRLALLSRPTVAVVGARNASASGARFARQIAADLGAAGLVVASGLARGVDAAAHQGALATGTTAVVAGGLDVVYPPENRALQAEIAEHGAIVAEMPIGTTPQARHFPRRNRLISGAALGVVVVEAAERSGSLITARMALEQGREVFAVPGSPLDPRCKGTNGLIRQGATLTENAGDVLDALRPLLGDAVREAPAAAPAPAPVAPPDEGELDFARRLVLDRLGPTPVDADELIRQCELTVGALATILLELELAGRLDRHPGNRVSIR